MLVLLMPNLAFKGVLRNFIGGAPKKGIAERVV